MLKKSDEVRCFLTGPDVSFCWCLRITLREFIEGATRLRGSAKALDIWRMETKVELLFEQLVGILQDRVRTKLLF